MVRKCRRWRRLIRKVQHPLPAMDATETVSRYCFDCSSRMSYTVLHGLVASVCQTGMPNCFHEGNAEVPPSRVEFQQGRSGPSTGRWVSAHRSASVPPLSREMPKKLMSKKNHVACGEGQVSRVWVLKLACAVRKAYRCA